MSDSCRSNPRDEALLEDDEYCALTMLDDEVGRARWGLDTAFGIIEHSEFLSGDPDLADAKQAIKDALDEIDLRVHRLVSGKRNLAYKRVTQHAIKEG